ncbi:hypothetical protein EVJ58_g7970 [Rhodofomes roseus]|uniref:Uncharacterized protein n=1 Tax=Rhodofomes roseus TaxID=34475 RepID=A0A4Y9Y0I7_9APHY|nr:hypothetical protein EVJ58_g7970 [Rhodofomes roseus]
MASAIKRLWDVLERHAHDEWEQFAVDPEVILIARNHVKSIGLEGLEDLIDTSSPPSLLDDHKRNRRGFANPKSILRTQTSGPRDNSQNVDFAMNYEFYTARSLLAVPQWTGIKLDISSIQEAYHFGKRRRRPVWWLYGAVIQEIETIVRVILWKRYPDHLYAVVRDRYGSDMVATWTSASYPHLVPDTVPGDTLRLRGHLDWPSESLQSAHHRNADSALDPTGPVFVICSTWIEGMAPDILSPMPKIFIHSMRAKRQLKDHYYTSAKARYKDVKVHLVPSFAALHALIQDGILGLHDAVEKPPVQHNAGADTMPEVLASLLKSTFRDYRRRFPAQELTLQKLLRDVAKPLLLYDDLKSITVCEALSLLVHRHLLKEAINKYGQRVYW